MKSGTTCTDCGRPGLTLRGLAIHKSRMHPFRPAPPPPKKETKFALSDLPETLRLVNGTLLEVGDVFWQVRKFVIKTITKTEGENTVEVSAECTKRHWTQNQPL